MTKEVKLSRSLTCENKGGAYVSLEVRKLLSEKGWPGRRLVLPRRFVALLFVTRDLPVLYLHLTCGWRNVLVQLGVS